jgi:hypothetical protein
MRCHLRPTSLAAVLLASAGLLAAACASPADQAAPPFKPVATVDEVMDGIVIPGSNAIFDAVIFSNGELVQAPQDDQAWHELQMQALAVAEAGNLLMMAPRARDAGEWMTLSLAMTDRAEVVAQAAAARDGARLLATGGDLYTTCTECHDKYLNQ